MLYHSNPDFQLVDFAAHNTFSGWLVRAIGRKSAEHLDVFPAALLFFFNFLKLMKPTISWQIFFSGSINDMTEQHGKGFSTEKYTNNLLRNVKLLAWPDMLTPDCIVYHPALLSSQGRDC